MPSTLATSRSWPATVTAVSAPSASPATDWTSNHERRRSGRRDHHRELHAGGGPGRRGAGDHRQARSADGLRRDALDLEALEVGRRLLERLLDRQLERHRRRRAVRAAAAQVDPRDPVLERQQLDVAAVGLHVRADRVERRLHPILERDRMQVVDQQQRADQRVLGERGRDPLAVGAGVQQRGEDPLEAGAVHLHDRRDELLGELARHRRAARLEPVWSSWTRSTSSSGVLRESAVRVHSPTPTPSACASPCAPCPRRCTCARRTAGTGRTSAPPA